MYQVKVTPMDANLNDEAVRASEKFYNWQDAYNHYGHLCNKWNLTNAQWTGAQDMNLEAGGIGFDYRVELIVEVPVEEQPLSLSVKTYKGNADVFFSGNETVGSLYIDFSGMDGDDYNLIAERIRDEAERIASANDYIIDEDSFARVMSEIKIHLDNK